MILNPKNLSPIAKGFAALIFLAFIGGNAVAGAYFFAPFYFYEHKPVQPVNFSHKLHAGDNKIPCQYCHTLARRSETAGVPSTQRCMNCHEYVKPEAPEIVKVLAHHDEGKPIEWNRVFDLPDHVWFNHKRHIKKGFKCQECHGAIETLDVLSRTNEFQMGFCLGCHQKNEAPTDCWVCHT